MKLPTQVTLLTVREENLVISQFVTQQKSECLNRNYSTAALQINLFILN